VYPRITGQQARSHHAALGGDNIKNLKLGLEDLMALFRPGREEEDDD